MYPPLDPASTWDDQGLYFTSALNAAIFVVLAGISIFVHHVPVMWLRRLYRTNHTTIVPSSSCLGTSKKTVLASTVTSNLYSCFRGVGRALPYRCSLFTFPSWRSWFSIEEDDVVHLESVFPCCTSPSRVDTPRNTPMWKEEVDVEEDGNDDDDERQLSQFSSEGPVQSDVSVEYPKTILDPQVALYLAFLKLFATIFILGSCFNLWICVLSGTDSYLEQYMVRRDIHHCHHVDSNQTACLEKSPFCRYVDHKGCFPEPLRGLYDLSAQNITPRDWRLLLVSMFDLCFCALYAMAIFFFLRRVDAYISVMMRLQMERALGHRVAIVRGLREEMMSEEDFIQNYLVEDAYFPSKKKKTKANAANNTNSRNDDDDVDDYHQYYRCDCTGADCLFSVVRFNYYKTTRRDAVFMRDGSVRKILFTCNAPFGIYESMKKTEAAMEALQEAIADEKSYLQMPLSKKQKKLHDKMLMTRASFPHCCTKVRKVDYWKKTFIARATHLNSCIHAIPNARKNGSAFIIFANALSAYEFMNLFELRYGGVSSMKVSIAGPPTRIIHMNITADRHMTWLRTVLVFIAYVVLLFFWSVPVGVIGSLDNIARIPGIGESIQERYQSLPDGLRTFISNYFPVLMLEIFNLVLPLIIRGFVVGMGVINEVELQGGELHLQYVFMVLTGVVFQAALQGGFFQLGDLISDPSSEAIINFFVALVTPQSGYWYAKVITAISLSTWLNLISPVQLLQAVFRRNSVSLQRVYDSLFVPCKLSLPQLYSLDLTVLAMGLLFHMTAPLLSFFVGVYFLVRYMTQRCRLYDRYRPHIHPLNDCSFFTASALVMRAATWLYCLGGVGGVLFMSLRKHVAGVVFCFISLMIGAMLLAHVHIVSQRWIFSLANARRLLSCGSSLPGQYGSSAPSSARRSTTTPMGEKTGKMKKKRPSVTNVVSDGCSREELSRRLMLPSDSRSVDEPNSKTRASGGRTDVGVSFAKDDWGPTTSLLPQVSHIGSHYQPSHQRLAHIDIEGEIERLKESISHVERYWDVPYEIVSDNMIIAAAESRE